MHLFREFFHLMPDLHVFRCIKHCVELSIAFLLANKVVTVFGIGLLGKKHLISFIGRPRILNIEQ